MALSDTISALGTSIINLVNRKVASYVPPTATDINLGVVKPDNTTITIDGNGVISSNGGASRNIGEIVSSTVPLVDAGLHLLDGSLIQGAGIYSAFVDYMADLYGDGTDVPNYFCTESAWQTAVTTYGVCGKFVYDSTNNTVRLPKITGIVEGTTDVTALGDLVEAGLPNITGTFNGDYSARSTGAFYNLGSVSGNGGDGSDNLIGFDASRSSSIYGNSTTVQPQTIKVLYYIVIATSTKTDIQVDIDEIATDLNGKADVDLTNLSNGLANTICTRKATTVSSASAAKPAVVVENYVAGASWYRVYSDGWCEQGGKKSVSSTGTINVTYLKEFMDNNYTLIKNNDSGNSGSLSVTSTSVCYTATTNKSATGFSAYQSTQYTGLAVCYWMACGFININ